MSVPGGEPPGLAPRDAELLAVLFFCGFDKKSVTLLEVLEALGWLDHWWPDDDDLSFGLPRLVANDYLTLSVPGDKYLWLHGTPKAAHLRPCLVPDGALARSWPRVAGSDATYAVVASRWSRVAVGDPSPISRVATVVNRRPQRHLSIDAAVSGGLGPNRGDDEED